MGGRIVRAHWLSRVSYRRALDLQRAVVAAIRATGRPDALLLLEHPAVFTVTKRSDGSTLLWSREECARRGVEIVPTDRGGDVTYHGPGQLVAYPILDLDRLGTDILRYIRDLEQSLVAYLRTLGIDAHAGGSGMTGVWSAGAKVAAIGVKLNQHVTSHGLALNLTADLDVFNQGIVPCGLVGKRATSVLELGGPRLDVEGAAHGYVPHFADRFAVTVEWADPAEIWTLPPAEPEPGPGRATLAVVDPLPGQSR